MLQPGETTFYTFLIMISDMFFFLVLPVGKEKSSFFSIVTFNALSLL